jgi:hypothetical protein
MRKVIFAVIAALIMLTSTGISAEASGTMPNPEPPILPKNPQEGILYRLPDCDPLTASPNQPCYIEIFSNKEDISAGAPATEGLDNITHNNKVWCKCNKHVWDSLGKAVARCQSCLGGKRNVLVSNNILDQSRHMDKKLDIYLESINWTLQCWRFGNGVL